MSQYYHFHRCSAAIDVKDSLLRTNFASAQGSPQISKVICMIAWQTRPPANKLQPGGSQLLLADMICIVNMQGRQASV